MLYRDYLSLYADSISKFGLTPHPIFHQLILFLATQALNQRYPTFIHKYLITLGLPYCHSIIFSTIERLQLAEVTITRYSSLLTNYY